MPLCIGLFISMLQKDFRMNTNVFPCAVFLLKTHKPINLCSVGILGKAITFSGCIQ